jgi:hypothetical protein
MKREKAGLAIAIAATFAVAAAIRPAGVLAARGAPETPQASSQQESAGHSHEKCELHGGEVVMTPANHFEVLFTDHEARVYVYDEKQAPIVSLDGAKATLTLLSKTAKSEPLPMTYLKPDSTSGRTQGVFVVRHDFIGIEKTPTKALFHLEGVAAKAVEFKSAVTLGERSSYVCPMHPNVTGEDPGRCSRCGMNLVKQGGPAQPGHAHDEGVEHPRP